MMALHVSQILQRSARCEAVPDRILIAYFPKLRVYGFWPGERRFAELLKILEKDDVIGSGGCPGALRMVGIGPGKEKGRKRVPCSNETSGDVRTANVTVRRRLQ
jgi:hypothetical protein